MVDDHPSDKEIIPAKDTTPEKSEGANQAPAR